MHHIDRDMLLKIVVIVTTAVVFVYFGALGYLDFIANAPTIATTAEELVKRGSYDRAIRTYRAELQQLDTQTVNTLLGLAIAYERNEQLAEAEATLRKVITRDSEEKDAYVLLANLLIDQGRVPDAQLVVAAAEKAIPNDADLGRLADDLRQSAE